jgi:hypothetical protein
LGTSSTLTEHTASPTVIEVKYVNRKLIADSVRKQSEYLRKIVDLFRDKLDDSDVEVFRELGLMICDEHRHVLEVARND